MTKLDERLQSLHYQPDDNWQHVMVTDQTVCQDCQVKQCLTICPSGVFVWNQQTDQPVLVLYKQCVECGACRLICANIDFSYPHGGYGVIFNEG